MAAAAILTYCGIKYMRYILRTVSTLSHAISVNTSPEPRP